MPIITVIVPVYKVEPYLRRCVDSILAQTLTDFELILVDDGSPDESGKFSDEYIENDPRIIVIHQRNGGLSAARNSGIDWSFICSNSDWLGLVDSDDWIHPQMYEMLYKAAVDNNVDLAVCGFKMVSGLEKDSNISEITTITHNGLDFFTSDQNVVATVAWNKLYRKDLLQSQRYPLGKLHEDEFLTYKLLYQAGKIAYIDAMLYYYYQNESGIMGSGYNIRNLDAVEGIEGQYSFFCGLNESKYKMLWKPFLMNVYTKHIGSLRMIKETERANALYKKAKNFFIHECSDRKENYNQYERAWLMFFPVRTKMRNRFLNFCRLKNTKSTRNILRYYFEKKRHGV